MSQPFTHFSQNMLFTTTRLYLIHDDANVTEHDLTKHCPSAGVYYSSNIIIYDGVKKCLKLFKSINGELEGGNVLIDIKGLLLFSQLENRRGGVLLRNGVLMIIPLYLLEDLGNVKDHIVSMLGNYATTSNTNYECADNIDYIYYKHKDCQYLEFIKLKDHNFIGAEYKQDLIVAATNTKVYLIDLYKKSVKLLRIDVKPIQITGVRFANEEGNIIYCLLSTGDVILYSCEISGILFALTDIGCNIVCINARKMPHHDYRNKVEPATQSIVKTLTKNENQYDFAIILSNGFISRIIYSAARLEWESKFCDAHNLLFSRIKFNGVAYRINMSGLSFGTIADNMMICTTGDNQLMLYRIDRKSNDAIEKLSVIHDFTPSNVSNDTNILFTATAIRKQNNIHNASKQSLLANGNRNITTIMKKTQASKSFQTFTKINDTDVNSSKSPSVNNNSFSVRSLTQILEKEGVDFDIDDTKYNLNQYQYKLDSDFTITNKEARLREGYPIKKPNPEPAKIPEEEESTLTNTHNQNRKGPSKPKSQFQFYINNEQKQKALFINKKKQLNAKYTSLSKLSNSRNMQNSQNVSSSIGDSKELIKSKDSKYSKNNSLLSISKEKIPLSGNASLSKISKEKHMKSMSLDGANPPKFKVKVIKYACNNQRNSKAKINNTMSVPQINEPSHAAPNKKLKLPVIRKPKNEKIDLKTINDLLRKLQQSISNSNPENDPPICTLSSQVQYSGIGRDETLLLKISNEPCGCKCANLCAEFSSRFNIDAMIKEISGEVKKKPNPLIPSNTVYKKLRVVKLNK